MNVINKDKFLNTVAEKGHFFSHCTYLILVFMEAHGTYGIAAAVLFFFVCFTKGLEK